MRPCRLRMVCDLKSQTVLPAPKMIPRQYCDWKFLNKNKTKHNFHNVFLLMEKVLIKLKSKDIYWKCYII